MRGVDTVLGKLSQCIPVYICAKTCSYSLKYHRLESISSEDVMSLILTDKEIILGDITKKLEDLITDILSRQDPQIIAIVSTCLPELLGIPLTAFASRLSEATGKRIIATQTECLRYPNYRDGIDITLASLCAQLGAPNITNRDESRLNLIGGMRISEQVEIKNMLKPYGVVVNSAVPNTSVEAYDNISNARMCIALSYNFKNTLDTMESKFGIKTIAAPPPIGLRATKYFYEQIVCHYKSDMNHLRAQLLHTEKMTFDRIKPSLSILQDKSIAIFGCTMDELPLAVALQELGMKVLYVSTLPITTGNGQDFDGFGFPVEFQSNISNDLELIRKYNPDFVIGSFPHLHLAREMGIPSTQIFWALQRKYGFDGVTYLTKFMSNILSKSIYRKAKEFKNKWMSFNMK